MSVVLGPFTAGAPEAARSSARDPGPAARKTFPDLARSRSGKAFMRGTLVCDVEKGREGVRFFPARNRTRRPLAVSDEEAPLVVLPQKTLPTELGAAILRAFLAVTPKRERIRKIAAET